MKKANSLLIAGGLLITSANAMADAPSFTYIGAEYVPSGDIELQDGGLSVSLDSSGYALHASVELGIFFIQASRTELESNIEILGIRAEDTSSTLAAGMTFELPQTQIYALVRGRYDEFKLSGLRNDEDDGGIIGGEVGARINVGKFLEINANVGKPSTDEGKSYGIGAHFFITDHFGITLDLRSIEAEQDDIEAKFDTTSVGLRYTF